MEFLGDEYSVAKKKWSFFKKKKSKNENYICIKGEKYPILSMPAEIIEKPITDFMYKDLVFTVWLEDWKEIFFKIKEI